LKLDHVSRVRAQAEWFPQRQRCGLIEAGADASEDLAPTLFPQRQRCGLIEAPVRVADRISVTPFPQRQRCGLIEAPVRVADRISVTPFPQRQRCGLIEALTTRRTTGLRRWCFRSGNAAASLKR